MAGVIKRLWRWITNPVPIVGQVWYLDGIGLVQIVGFYLKGAYIQESTHEKPLFRMRTEFEVRPLKAIDGITGMNISPRTLRSSAELWQPSTLKQLTQQDEYTPEAKNTQLTSQQFRKGLKETVT